MTRRVLSLSEVKPGMVVTVEKEGGDRYVRKVERWRDPAMASGSTTPGYVDPIPAAVGIWNGGTFIQLEWLAMNGYTLSVTAESCSVCRHAEHGNRGCLNMASDNDCDCHGPVVEVEEPELDPEPWLRGWASPWVGPRFPSRMHASDVFQPRPEFSQDRADYVPVVEVEETPEPEYREQLIRRAFLVGMNYFLREDDERNGALFDAWLADVRRSEAQKIADWLRVYFGDINCYLADEVERVFLGEEETK